MLRCAETFPGSFPTLQKLLKPLGGTLSQRLILLAMNKAKLPLMQRNCILVYYIHQDCQNRKTANLLRWLKDSSCCFTSFSPVYKKLKSFKDSDSKKPAKIRDLAWESRRINNPCDPSSMSCLCITMQDSSTLRSATSEISIVYHWHNWEQLHAGFLNFLTSISIIKIQNIFEAKGGPEIANINYSWRKLVGLLIFLINRGRKRSSGRVDTVLVEKVKHQKGQ